MISRVCTSKNTHIKLDFKADEPFVVAVEPFTTTRQIELSIHEPGPIRVLCVHLHTDIGAFSVPYNTLSFAEIPPDSYFIITEDSEGYTVYFCLSHQNISVSLSGMPGGIRLHLKNGTSQDDTKLRNVLVCMKSKNVYEAIRSTMKLALSLTGGMGKLLDDKLPPPPWLDGLGWESGVAMGAHVSHEGVIESVKSLVEAGYAPGFVLIDEGWQHLEKRALASFEADVHRFPKGIKGVIDDLMLLGVKHVGVWHGMMGYRGGVHSGLAHAYDLPCSHDGRYFLGNDLGSTFEFFFDYYGYLREQGVAFIKVGDQSSVSEFCGEGMQTTQLYKILQSAMQAAASIQFNSAHFNTECLRNENLFYWGNSRIARAAEDIDVSNPLGVMSAIRNNLTNSLWLQHLMQPDFDAWLTCTEQSEMLAIYHALSGSINVIGDLAGEHNKALINKFLLPCGHLLKADRPLTLCKDSIFCNPLEEKKVYKAFTSKGSYGIIGAFNLVCGKRTVHGTVSPSDIEGLAGDLFALFSHHNGFVKLVRKDEHMPITLKPNESDVLTFAPVHKGIAVLGGYQFFLAPGPILDLNIEDDAMHISTLVSSGIMIYCERQILEVRRNGKTIPWEYDNKRHTLSIDSRTRITPGHAQYTITFEA